MTSSELFGKRNTRLKKKLKSLQQNIPFLIQFRIVVNLFTTESRLQRT